MSNDSYSTISDPALLGPDVSRSNLWRLTLAQALAGANSVVVFATGAIVGSMLAPSPLLATLPISIFVVGMAVCVFPAGELARKYGRKAAFMVGSVAGVLTGLLAMAAMFTGLFWLFCLSTLLGGAYAAVVLSFRFAVTDGLPPEKRPQALSLVMAGGIVAGVIGPQLVTQTMYLWPEKMFAATFLAQAVVAVISGVILYGVQSPAVKEQHGGGRPLLEIALQPRFISAVVCGAASYMIMNFLMTAAPLAMHMHGHSHESSNLGIQWHVIAMYAPSFFTGKLIARFGAVRISAIGIVLTGISAAVGLLGVDVNHFWWLLILLGIGWNFGFLGASALVLECHKPEEKNRVQSLNDFIIFGLMAIGSFSSGGLLSAYGWQMVLWVSFVPLILAALALAAAKVGKLRA
ncbi:MFS transporter [Vibrio diazotrophicus]|uniref:Putative MFS family arabinose efflux permease n=1 Tax=Vibrio diazotrophicus TaxID=685 RepID=A0A329EB96_VIBDI|nr:MFS transporter [Vibrio diazotrophicus]PNH93560.1 MFS transporter [Vibrio diazotrophicus]RAS66311.1 putative MFS family arabinose efflux permease [Vibrio diazotrophicus]